MHKKLATLGSILIVISLLEEVLAGKNAEFAEWFCQHIYPGISAVFRIPVGFLPFSLVEILLYLWIFFTIAGFLYVLVKRHMLTYLAIQWLFLSILSLLYVNNCGINYYAPGFAEQIQMKLKEYQTDELEEVCLYLAEQVEYYSERIDRDENLLLKEQEDWRKVAKEAMEKTGGIENPLKGSYPLPKPIAVSYILSIQQVTGVYSPFTVEANYNKDIPSYNKPFTMCHELSHLKGFMQEKEANFIAFRACIESDDPTFCYSGYLNALVYCTNALYRSDPEKCNQIWQKRSEGVMADVRFNNAFWRKYDGRTSEIHEKINDYYLKANGQKEGASGYDYMVDLVVSWYEAEYLEER